MRLGREIVRACLAGTAMHFIIVAACSAGGDGARPGLQLTSGTSGSTGIGAAEAGASGNQATPAGASGGTAAGGTMLDTMMPVAEARAAESGFRLKARWYVGADGSRQFINWFDSVRERECYFQPAFDGSLRCIPQYVYAAKVFADAACTQPFAYVSGCAPSVGETISLIVSSSSEVCGQSAASSEVRYFAAGLAVQPISVWSLTANGCQSSAVSTSGAYIRLGAEVPLAAFVAGQVEVE